MFVRLLLVAQQFKHILCKNAFVLFKPLSLLTQMATPTVHHGTLRMHVPHYYSPGAHRGVSGILQFHCVYYKRNSMRR